MLLSQAIFSATVGLTLLAATLAISHVSPVLKSMFSPPALAFETVMACKVFRSVILRSLRDVEDHAVVSGSCTSAVSIFELDTQFPTRMDCNEQEQSR